jgi:hypothetical protein
LAPVTKILCIQYNFSIFASQHPAYGFKLFACLASLIVNATRSGSGHLEKPEKHLHSCGGLAATLMQLLYLAAKLDEKLVFSKRVK